MLEFTPRISARMGVALVLGVLCTVVCVCVHAQVLMGADERLEAIRNSLVQAALEGQTEVKSTSWVDENGALKESNSFTSGMQVRGVRILSYTRDEAGEAKAKFTTDAKGSLSGAVCSKASFSDHLSAWHHMTLEINLSQHMTGQQKFRANQLMQELHRNLLQLANQSKLVHFGDMTLPASRYEQMLVGKGEEYIPWRVKLALSVSPDSLASAPTFEAHFEVTERSLPNVFLSFDQLISMDSYPTNSTPRPLAPVVMQEVQAVSDAFIKNLESKLACTPPQFQVLKMQSDTYRINGGSMSGLRVGDRLVVADKEKIPNRVLEPAALEKMAMTQVTSVSGYYADLKQIAGPKLSGNAQWVAVVQSR
jgi:hypothetical protein